MGNYGRWGDDARDRAELDRWITRTPEEAWGLDDADNVSAYSREDALAVGVLRDATPVARELGVAVPAALTAGAWEALECDDATALRRVITAAVLALVMESRARGREVARVDLALAGVRGWVACWATTDGDGLTVLCEGED